MGKGKRKQKNKAKSSAAGGGVGGEGSKTNNDAENDILLSLEESYDWHNQTTGFVSSYTLPPLLSESSASCTSATASASIGATLAGVVAEKNRQRNDGNHNNDIALNNMSSLIQPIVLSRSESIESAASSKASATDGMCVEGSGIRDIFRPPSRSPSRSPRSRQQNDMRSPSERSIASDSTDAVSNLASLNLSSADGSTPNKIPPAGGGPSPRYLFPAAAAAAKNAVSKRGKSDGGSGLSGQILDQVISANDERDMAGISPLRGSPSFADNRKQPQTQTQTRQIQQSTNQYPNSPAKSRRKQSSGNKLKPHRQKNNLVIQPTHSNLSQSSPSFGHRKHKSVSGMPPTHPLSHVQSYPPQQRMLPASSSRHRYSSSVQSMSDASCASEATPVISPAHREIFSFSDDDDEDDEGAKDGSIIAKGILSTGDLLHGVGITFHPDDNDEAASVIPQVAADISDRAALADENGHENIADQADYATSSSDDIPLIDLHPAFPSSDDNAPTNFGASPLPLNPEPPIVHPPEDVDNDVEYGGEDFFERARGHTRQFSSDDRFFEGIRNSGLQSMSFESVENADLSTSMDVEIELVYNASDSFGAFSHDTANDGRSLGKQTESFEDRQRGEERREAVKRIMQWRRGRNAMRNSAIGAAASIDLEMEHHRPPPPKGRENDEEDEEDEFKNIEMRPLNYSIDSERLPSDGVNATNGHSDNEGHHKVGKYSSSWRSPILVFIKNYTRQLWPQDKHSDLVTPRTNNTSTSSLAQTSFNDDGEEDEDDGDESKGLTSSVTTHFRKRRKYDDVDFDRNANFCSRFCCKYCERNDYGYTTNGSRPLTWRIQSGWKDLLATSAAFFLLAWIFSHGHLKKHHNSKHTYPGYNGNDPLAREHFLDGIRHVDDTDDTYYSPHTLNSPKDDDDGFHSRSTPSILKNENAAEDNKFFGMGAIVANDRDHKQQLMTSRYNDFAGIDTIVVLGLCEERHSGVDWLVDRLDKLYPGLKVVRGFPSDNDFDASKPTKRALRTNVDDGSRLARSRLTKIIDPTTSKQIDNSRSDGRQTPGYYNDNAIFDNHRKSHSAHILVISVFINPYDWVELMRVDSSGPNYGRSHHTGMEWKEYVQAVMPRNDRNVLEMRANNIRLAMIGAVEHDGVKLVIPVRYESLVEPYSNYDNYVKTETLDESSSLPGIVGLMDQIQARTGLHPDETAGWKDERQPSKISHPSSYWAADPVGCTGHICFPSIHRMKEDGAYIQYINDHVDWNAERMVGYQRRAAPKPPVDRIVVLGERHSGAEWLVDRLARCFPDIKVLNGFPGRPGKFFQVPPEYAQGSPVPKTLVVSVFVNPYDWVELMRDHPINAPSHADMEWADFVTSPWERRRSHLDETLVDTANADCSYGFSYEEIIPCRTQRDPDSDSFPLYELHPASSGVRAGDPYSSLLELRTDKIRNFLGVADYEGVVDLINVRYEDLVWNEGYANGASDLTLPFPGIAGLFEEMRDRTSLVPDVDAGWISDVNGIFRADALGTGVAKLDPYYVHWMEEHVDWDAEMLVGYNP